MTRPLLLDLFCGAGGAAVGYERAGFDVVGVDIVSQPNYPFDLVVADALEVLLPVVADGHLGKWRVDAIHASPPCQAYTAMRVMENAGEHPELIPAVRAELGRSGKPYVIENVEQSPLEIHPPSLLSGTSGVVLCGSMFGLRTERYELRRHRLFETNVPLYQPPHQHRSDLTVIGFYGDHARTRTRINGHHARGTDIVRKAEKLALVRDLMDIDWMTWAEAKEAIPPAYTEFVGSQLIEQLERVA